MKNVFNVLHALVYKIAHFCLIPIMAVLDGAIALLQRFRDELGKI